MTDTDTEKSTESNTDRRSRGLLEADVKTITDEFATGKIELKEGEHLTPHRIAKLIQEKDSLEKPPSTGAVAAVLGRWQEYGFAVVNPKPLAFVDYTDDARNVGLTALKEQHSNKLRAERAEKKAAAKAAEKPDASGEKPAEVNAPDGGNSTATPGPAPSAQAATDGDESAGTESAPENA